MRIGCVASIDQAAIVKAAGFDFLEVIVQHVLRGEETDETWDKTAPDPAKLPLPIEAANMLVPAKFPIVGPARDLSVLSTYMKRVASRAKRLGIQTLVFGSGGARKRPDDVPLTTTLEHLTQFTRMAGEICGEQGVMLVIEHLNRKEANTINSLEESLHICNLVNLPSVAVLADTYHFGLENETEAALLNCDGQLQHVHVAEVAGRVPPGAGEWLPGGLTGAAFDFVEFFETLHKMGYDGRIAIECAWPEPIEKRGAHAAAFLRKAWTDAACD